MLDYIKNLLLNFLFYRKNKFINRPDWSKELQTSPPNFGKAKRIDNFQLNNIIETKKKLIPQKYSKKKNNQNISIVILTCKREQLFENLIKKLKFFLKNVETYKYYDIYVVDNGSNKTKNSLTCKENNIDNYIYFKKNLGMSNALRKVYKSINSDYIMFVEDDFDINYEKPFLKNCVEIFEEFKDIGIIRLKNQNNWWKKERIISEFRTTKNNVNFWTWIPKNEFNGWCAGSVIFKKECYDIVGGLPYSPNINRFQFYIYENYFAKKFNKMWNAAKIENCYPFFQPNDNDPIL